MHRRKGVSSIGNCVIEKCNCDLFIAPNPPAKKFILFTLRFDGIVVYYKENKPGMSHWVTDIKLADIYDKFEANKLIKKARKASMSIQLFAWEKS